ncbi:MAG TPA: hypothetical protein VF796_27360 [Humisphaera sp.]
MRILSIVLILLGVSAVIGGFTFLRTQSEDAPTAVSVKDVEADKLPPGKKWLKVTDGVLCWKGPSYKSPRSRKKDEKVDGYYVALASPEAYAAMTAPMTKPEDKPSFEKPRVMVFVTEAELKAKNPKWDVESNLDAIGSFEAQGLVEPLTAAPPDLKNKLASQTTGLDVTKVIVLDVGEQPVPRGAATTWLVGGAAATLVGVGLWFLGRAQAKRRFDEAHVALPADAGAGEYPPAADDVPFATPAKVQPLPKQPPQ